MEACEATVRVLVEGGVRYFAGMAGSTVSPFIAAAARAPGARYVPVRHEHVAASLLDATARLTGRPGCVLVHSAAGTLAASLGGAAAVGRLRAARRATIVVGGGAAYSGAGGELQRLAERLCAPIVNSATTRGIVSEDHPLSLGPSGIVGDPASGDAIRTADLLLAIGSRLSDIQTARGALLPAAVPVIQVNLDPSEIGRVYPVTLGIAADARTFLEDLIRRLDEGELDVPAERREWARGLRRGADDWYAAWLAQAPDNGRLQAQEVVRSLAELLPDEAVLSYGAGDHTFYGTTVPAHGRQRHV